MELFKEGDWVYVETNKESAHLNVGDVFKVCGDMNRYSRYCRLRGIDISRLRHATKEEIRNAEYPKEGVALLVRLARYDCSWQLRYSAGSGRYYIDGRKSGINTNPLTLVAEWRILDIDNLPVNLTFLREGIT